MCPAGASPAQQAGACALRVHVLLVNLVPVLISAASSTPCPCCSAVVHPVVQHEIWVQYMYVHVLGERLDKSDTDRFRKDDEWYFVWWKGKDLKVYHFDSQ